MNPTRNKKNNKRKSQESGSLAAVFLRFIRARLRGFRLSVSIDGEALARGAVCAGLLILFCMLQTTAFARFRPFGAVPDLMLAFTVAIAITEGEKWGAVTGLASAFIIEALGGVTITLLPLLYMPTGLICGVLAKYYFSDSPLIRLIYMSVASVARVTFTVVYIMILADGYTLPAIFVRHVIPEYFSTLLMSVPVHLICWLCLRHFHKSRAEKVL